MILAVISISVIAMDKKQESLSDIVKQVQKLDGIKFIEVSSNQDIYTSYTQESITDLCSVYREYFEEIKKRDLIFCVKKTFTLRMPSFYLKQFQEKQFFNIKKRISSLKGLWFFFSSDEYEQMDKHFVALHKKNKDLEKTWDDFISYFLDAYVVRSLVDKKYYSKDSPAIPIS